MKAKRILFAVLTTIVLLLIATAILQVLEKKRLIQTERPDDRVAAPPVNWLHEDATPHGAQMRIEHETMITSRFMKKKSDNTLRVFVTGGSFAMGFPIVEQSQDVQFGGITEWIRDELRRRYPQGNFEIINVAAGAQNSFRVVEIVKELVKLEPDVIFVMTGNNEGFVPRYYLNQALHQWVVYRVLKRQLLPDFTLDQRLRKKLEINSDEVELEKYYLRNINKIIELTKENSVELMLAAMPINLRPGRDNLPEDDFAEKMRDPHLQAGLALQEQGDCPGAIERYAQSEHLGIGAYLIGSCWEMLGDFAKAKSYYLLSLEFCPGMRARRNNNAAIRELAEQHRLHLVDLETWAETLSPHGIPSDNLYHDICHLTPSGYYLMAREALRVMERDRLIPAAFGPPRPKPSLEKLIEVYNYNPDDYRPLLGK